MNAPLTNKSCGISHSFDIGIASELGMAAAVLYNHFFWWISENREEGLHFYEGRTWTFHSVKKMQKRMPYLSIQEIRTALDKLIKGGYLITGKFNSSNLNHTLWYAFADESRIFKIISPICYQQQIDLLPATKHIVTKSEVTKKSGGYSARKEPQQPAPKKVSPPLSSSKKTEEKPKSVQAEVQHLIEEIKRLKIPIKDSTVLAWIKKYGVDKVIAHVALFVKRNRSKKIDKPEAWIQLALKEDYVGMEALRERNKLFAENFKRDHHWKNLIITKSYVRDELTGKDLGFGLPEENFKQVLKHIFKEKIEN
jgi:hypothetical protein